MKAPRELIFTVKSIKYYTKGQNLLSGGNLLVHSITGTITAIDQEIFEQII